MSPLLYLQSGGPTAVLNASALGVIEAARRRGRPLLAARNGLAGLLDGQLVDPLAVGKGEVSELAALPGASFGVSRHMIPTYHEAPQEWLAMREVLARHGIHHLLLNGGNGSMGCAARLAEFERYTAYPLSVIGIPKTIDNDLVGTDFSPGFPSAAKFLATSMREVALDMNSMGQRRVFIMETMGRHTGWLAAATAAAARQAGDAPQMILLPEVPFDPAAFLPLLNRCLQDQGHCAIAVSEGLKGLDGLPLAEVRHDAEYGHEQLGGAGAWLANWVRRQTGITAHVAQVDCLQRAARHLASPVDLRLAYAVGRVAVEWALQGRTGVMVGIVRRGTASPAWDLLSVDLAEVGDRERNLPPEFIDAANLGVTPAFLDYLRPLLAGDAPPRYGDDGLPDYRPIAWPTAMADAHDLGRFIAAQADDYATVLEELRAGRKRGHWMWYIFPQLEGLGGSAMSQAYAIKSRSEARAYLAHPLLGQRLRECAQLVLSLEGRSARQIFPYPDALKFRSCMTLFDRVASDPALFRAVLAKYFDGEPDPLTIELLRQKAD